MGPLVAAAPFGFEVAFPAVLLGVIIGLTYGLLGVGLVLVFRSSRIVNFAHGEIGAFGAAFFTVLASRWSIPYWFAFPIVLVLGGGVGALCEVVVVRRLRNAPKVMSIVATLGIGQFLLGMSIVIAATWSGPAFPAPPGLPSVSVGSTVISPAHVAMLTLAPILVVAIVLFLRRSRYGIAIRCAADNAEAARMAAISPERMSALSWALAGGVSTFTAVLVAPSLGVSASENFGPSLLVRALAVAVVAGMANLPLALAAGVGLGIVEQLTLWNYERAGLVELALFVIILVVLLARRTQGGRDDEKGSWAAVSALRPLPEAVRAIPIVRRMGGIVGATAFVVALLLPIVISHSQATTLVTIMSYALVGLSVAVVTGLSGQLSLGQFGLAAVGATVSYHVAFRTGNYGLSFLYAGLAAAAVSLVIGLPALRVRGLLLAVTTLGFALVVPEWLLGQSWMLDAGVTPGRPIVLGRALENGKEYYLFVLAVFTLTMIVARNVRRGAFGRLLIAVRDNEDNARAFSVRARAVKLQGFLLAGFMAGIGGAVYGHMLSRMSPTTFQIGDSISAVVLAVIGGLGILAGPLIGAFYLIGIPAFLPLDAAGLAATSFGGLLLVLYLPGGIAHLVEPLRNRLVGLIARRHGIDLHAMLADDTTAEAELVAAHAVDLPVRADAARNGRATVRQAGSAPLLSARWIVKRFGGVSAVDDVTVEAYPGETLGLIGPNGAGKTTLFEILGGFTRPNEGRVFFDGVDVSDLPPEERARMGLIRSFQDAALFPSMTVQETVAVALERTRPSSFFGSVLGLHGKERARLSEADELVAYMGLSRYRDKQIGELSTGTRRITELACAIALRPTLLLLDEPAAGIAQRETEALGTLLCDLKATFHMTLVVIEHDMPLIMGLADRIVAMDAGRVVAEGTPEAVAHDPAVVEAYLGGSLDAIERSGARSGAPVAARARRRRSAGSVASG